MPTESPRQRYLKRFGALKSERSSWRDHWRDLSDQINPRRSRFLLTDRNQGGKKNSNIINSTPIRAHRTLAAGMMAGITSPARPWHKLTMQDQDLAKFGPVREWLRIVDEAVRTAFHRSNLYNCLHTIYEDLPFGTAAMLVEEDLEDVLRGYVFPLGQYALANSPRLQVDTIYRDLSMTVGQLVKAFGLNRCSTRVRDWYKNNYVDRWVEIVHVVEPNTARQYSGEGRPVAGAPGMSFRSCWFEASAPNDETIGFLRESGFEEFPIVAPRWSVTGEDVYGRGPGMDALGDCKALQHAERKKAQLIDKLVDPPMRGPAAMQNGPYSLLPGSLTAVDSVNGGASYEPAMDVNPQALVAIRSVIEDLEGGVESAFYADLWLAMIQADRGQITAREVEELHEEKLLQLGPVTERLQDELLEPLVFRAFSVLLRNGQLPPPPREIQGQEMKVDFISIMAQAQKAVATKALERVGFYVGELGKVRGDALDKLNVDKAIDHYNDAVGAPSDIILSDEQVREVRAQRAKAQQAAAQGQAMLAAAKGAKDLADVDLESDNAAARLLGATGAAAGGAA